MKHQTRRALTPWILGVVAFVAALFAAGLVDADTLTTRLCPTDEAFQAEGTTDCVVRYLPVDTPELCAAVIRDLARPGAIEDLAAAMPETFAALEGIAGWPGDAWCTGRAQRFVVPPPQP